MSDEEANNGTTVSDESLHITDNKRLLCANIRKTLNKFKVRQGL